MLRMSMEFDQFVAEVARVAREKGWWPNGERNFGEAIALMHSELSEALEEWRSGKPALYYKCTVCGREMDAHDESYRAMVCEEPKVKPEGILVEFADLFIRAGDFIGNTYPNASFEEILKEKMAFNLTRPHRHGGKKA